MSIERRILDELTGADLLAGREIDQILTGRSFAVAALTDGCVGVAMDYSHFRYGDGKQSAVSVHQDAAADRVLRRSAGPSCGRAPLLHIPADRLSLTEQAVKIALFSALARPLFTPQRLAEEGFGWTAVTFAELRAGRQAGPAHEALARAVGDADTVGVIGFGGLMESIAMLDGVGRILVSDLNHAPRLAYIEAVLARFNARFPRPKIEFVGPELGRLRQECAIVQVTPSSMCNGTMDEVLATLSGIPLIVVGPSGAVPPRVWFGHGARLLCLELKDDRMVTAYRYDDHLYDWFVEYDERLLLWP
jgi:hypothetical protein